MYQCSSESFQTFVKDDILLWKKGWELTNLDRGKQHPCIMWRRENFIKCLLDRKRVNKKENDSRSYQTCIELFQHFLKQTILTHNFWFLHQNRPGSTGNSNDSTFSRAPKLCLHHLIHVSVETRTTFLCGGELILWQRIQSTYSKPFLCDIIDRWDLFLTCNVAFKLNPMWKNTTVNKFDGQPLNSRSMWDHISHWTVSVRWPKWF